MNQRNSAIPIPVTAPVAPDRLLTGKGGVHPRKPHTVAGVDPERCFTRGCTEPGDVQPRHPEVVVVEGSARWGSSTEGISESGAGQSKRDVHENNGMGDPLNLLVERAVGASSTLSLTTSGSSVQIVCRANTLCRDAPHFLIEALATGVVAPFAAGEEVARDLAALHEGHDRGCVTAEARREGERPQQQPLKHRATGEESAGAQGQDHAAQARRVNERASLHVDTAASY